MPQIVPFSHDFINSCSLNTGPAAIHLFHDSRSPVGQSPSNKGFGGSPVIERDLPGVSSARMTAQDGHPIPPPFRHHLSQKHEDDQWNMELSSRGSSLSISGQIAGRKHRLAPHPRGGPPLGTRKDPQNASQTSVKPCPEGSLGRGRQPPAIVLPGSSNYTLR